jgi:hypothetical protein
MPGNAFAQAVGSDTGGADRGADIRGEAAVKDREKDREKKGELELCKERAQGLDGPERARFFTDCLRGGGRN